jgi:hypothetical protein
MELLQLSEGEQYEIFGKWRVEFSRQLARNFVGRARAVARTPDERSGLVETMGLISFPIVNQNFVGQIMNHQRACAEARKQRRACSLHRVSSY